MGQGLSEGDVFAGYRIRGTLGHGGMGAVYAAQHPRLPRTVAIKTLTAAADDGEAMARFEREAEMIARLDHPGIVSVLDRGVEQGLPWISMQFVQGSDAAEVLRRSGPLPVAQVTTIAAQTADALDYAHSRGVLHRDVKPGNIMLESTAPGRALLTDFGIATVLDHSRDITSTGQSLATLDYASPEQLTGQPLDGRADQYSLACTIYTLLTGRPPFGAGNVGSVVQGHLGARPPSAHTTRPELSPAASEVITRALSKDSGRRFASCREFAEAFRQAADSHHTTTSGPSPLPAPMPMMAPPPRRRSPATRWAAGAAALVILAAGGYALSRSLSHQNADGPVTTSTSTGTSPTTTTGTSTGTSTGGTGSLAVWNAVKPAQQIWPDLLPKTPTAVGYTGLKCAALTKKVSGTMPQYNYRLNCSRADGLVLEMLAYDTSKGVERVIAHYGNTHPIPITAADGAKLTVYKMVDPDNATTWMLLQVQDDAAKGAYAFQISGIPWEQQATFIAGAPW